MQTISLPFIRLPHAEGLALPAYATQHSAGCDLQAAIADDVVLQPLSRQLLPTGLALALPEGMEAQIRPRSGLALNHGITVLNAPGTIDADYRGEIKILLINLGEVAYTITRGMRIAQLVLAPVLQADWQQVELLEQTARGESGFGSTGMHAIPPEEKAA